MVIRYCDKCGVRVGDDELASGAARSVDDMHVLCAKCAPAPSPATASSSANSRAARKSPIGTRTIPPKPAVTAVRNIKKPAGNPLIPVAMVCVALAGITGLILFMMQSPPAQKVIQNKDEAPALLVPTHMPQAQTDPKGPVTTAQPAPVMDLRSDTAAELLEQLNHNFKTNPSDAWAYREKLEQLMARYAGTKAAQEIPALIASLQMPDKSTQGLVAFWSFDEGSGQKLVDKTGHGHDGTLVKDPKWVEGKFGGALSFDGSQYVQIAIPGDFILGESNFTLSVWAKSRVGGCMFSKTQKDGAWVMNGKSFFIGFEGGKTLGFDSHSIATIGGNQGVADDRWHHLAATFKKGVNELKLYVDGKEDWSGQLPLQADVADHEIRLGAGPAGARMSHYIGLLDEFAVYKRTLDPSEIKDLAEGRTRLFK